MGRNTIFREIKMDTFNSDLDLLENLSKKISDLIYNNEFSQISILDAQRKLLIEKKTNFMLIKLLRKKTLIINLKI